MKVWGLHLKEYYAAVKSHTKIFHIALFGVHLDGDWWERGQRWKNWRTRTQGSGLHKPALIRRAPLFCAVNIVSVHKILLGKKKGFCSLKRF